MNQKRKKKILCLEMVHTVCCQHLPIKIVSVKAIFTSVCVITTMHPEVKIHRDVLAGVSILVSLKLTGNIDKRGKN